MRCRRLVRVPAPWPGSGCLPCKLRAMSSSPRDNPLDALLHPFADGLLHWPEAGGVLFLRAREGAALHAARPPGLVATQPFRPEAARLERLGIDLLDEDALPAARYPAGAGAAAAPARRSARAVRAGLRGGRARWRGGRVPWPNDEGAKSREADLQAAGRRQRQHADQAPLPRVLDRSPARPSIRTLRRAVAAAGCAAPGRSRDVPGGGFVSRPGVFAWDRIDAASALLAGAPAGGPARPRGRSRRRLRLSVDAAAGALPAHRRARPVRGRGARAGAGAAQPGAARRLRTRVPVAFHWHDVDRRPAAALRRHRQQSAVPCAGRAPTGPNSAARSSPRPQPRWRRAAGCGWSPTGICRTRRCWPRGFAQRAHAWRRRGGFKVIEAVGGERAMKLVKLHRQPRLRQPQGRARGCSARAASPMPPARCCTPTIAVRARRRAHRRRAAGSAARPAADAAQAGRLHLLDARIRAAWSTTCCRRASACARRRCRRWAGSIATPPACCC